MTLPLSPRMSYGQMRMALYQVAPDLHVASARLPGKLDGVYCLSTNTVLIDRRITYTRNRCALVHELVHWRHGDDTTHGCLGGKNGPAKPSATTRNRPRPAAVKLCASCLRCRTGPNCVVVMRRGRCVV